MLTACDSTAVPISLLQRIETLGTEPLPNESRPEPISPPVEVSTDFLPWAPRSLSETGIPEHDIEALILKLLLHRGILSGRKVSEHLALPFAVLTELLRKMKAENLVVYKSSATLHDFEYELTPHGFERARRHRERCTYIGATPVSLNDYCSAIAAQSPLKTRPRLAEIQQALGDMVISPDIVDQIGQAVRGGRAMFLFGHAGNGKTSVSERVCRAYGPTIWIPRAINVDGEIVRVFDPILHEIQRLPEGHPHLKLHDARWVRIERPTIVVGGELSPENLELTPVLATGVVEAPVQLKANGGTLVIDDFGRQRISTRDLLNRWIFPLERRIDFLNTPGGKKVQVPFDQFVIFATNLAPKELVDEAFLRRIPYKIEMVNPTEAEFRQMFETMAAQMGIPCPAPMVDYLIDTHYRGANSRPFRSCHPRDLLLQIRNACDFRDQSPEVTEALLDTAVRNYFAAM